MRHRAEKSQRGRGAKTSILPCPTLVTTVEPVTIRLALMNGTEQPLRCRRGRKMGRKEKREEALGDAKHMAPPGFPVLETSQGHWTDEPRAHSEICQSHLKSVSISTTNKWTEGKNSNYKQKWHTVKM